MINQLDNPTKVCGTCGVILTEENRSLARLRMSNHRCRECVNQVRYAWRKNHPEQDREHRRRYRLKHKAVIAQNARKRQKVIKAEVLGHYGGICACCGETELDLLTIEHLNGGGSRHRRQLFGRDDGGSKFYRWLKNNHYPKEFAVLCWNCNWGKRVNKGVCPHMNEIKRIFDLSAQMKEVQT